MRSLILVLACVTACGEDTAGGPYIPIQMFNSAYHEAQCTHLVACGLFPDAGTCAQYLLASGFGLEVTPQQEAAVIAGKLYYSGTSFATCVAAIAAVTCDRTDVDGRIVPDPCNHVLRGAVAAGGECTFAAECVSQNCSLNCGQQNNTCCMGTCIGDTAPPVDEPAQIGQSCLTNSCVAGAYCGPTDATCTRLKSANTACNNSNECDYGLWCIGNPTETCRALPTLGQPCPDGLCRDEGQRCSVSTGTPTCVALALPGTACTSTTDCSQYFRCDVGVTNTCVPYPAPGQSCSQTGECANSAVVYCDITTLLCTANLDVGEPCTLAEACTTKFCDTTTHLCADMPICI